MSGHSVPAGDRRDLRRRIDVVERRLQSRRHAATRQAGALDHALRVAATSPLTLLLAVGAGFLAERQLARAARSPLHAAARPAPAPSRVRAGLHAVLQHALRMARSVLPFLWLARATTTPATAETTASVEANASGSGQRWSSIAIAGIALLALGAWLMSGIASTTADAWVHLLPPLVIAVALLIWASGGLRRR